MPLFSSCAPALRPEKRLQLLPTVLLAPLAPLTPPLAPPTPPPKPPPKPPPLPQEQRVDEIMRKLDDELRTLYARLRDAARSIPNAQLPGTLHGSISDTIWQCAIRSGLPLTKALVRLQRASPDTFAKVMSDAKATMSTSPFVECKARAQRALATALLREAKRLRSVP